MIPHISSHFAKENRKVLVPRCKFLSRGLEILMGYIVYETRTYFKGFDNDFSPDVY